MITRCPECGTKFRISVDIIRAEDSTVRCGDCMSVFDARVQLVDEASESSYVADSARERAARLRQQRQAEQRSAQSYAPYNSNGYERKTDGYQHSGEGHGAGWVSPGRDPSADRDSRDQPAEPVTPVQTRPDGQLLIDRRDSEADIDLDHADTIAYQPVKQFAEQPQARAERASLDLELAELDKIGKGVDNPILNDYSRRIDPLINPDDNSIEFERTLALEGLTGIESHYSEAGERRESHQSAVERSIEAASHAETAFENQSSSYVGEHQFDSLARDPGYARESETPETKLLTRTDFGSVPDVGSRSPRSERHLDDNQRSINRDSSVDDGYSRRPGHVARADQAGYSLERPRESDRSESAIAVRRHVSERGVEFDSEDDYEYVEGSRSSSVGWWLLALLAVACAAGFYARDDIAKSNLPQSVRAGFCVVAGCELPVASDIAGLELLRQQVYSHPGIENALIVSIDVVNNAVFPQPYPVLSVTMANSNGESVAQRDFVPADYLENYAGDETLKPGKPTRINIDIVDPGGDAQSFEMEFREL